jgi:hypothetical protein
VFCLLALLVAGCSPNPNALGVTDTGTVTGRLVDARTPTQPIQQALISVGTQTYRLSPSDNGAFAIPNVPIGTQPVRIDAIGYATVTLQVVVRKDQTTDISTGNPGAIGTAYGLAPTSPG